MKKSFIILCILIISSTGNAFANTFGGMDAGAINSQYVRDMRTHEFKSRARQNSAIVKPKTEINKQVIPEVVSEIKKISFVDNRVFPSSQLQAVVSSKIDKPMTGENIAAIRRDIMRYYQAHGYYSAVAIISAQDNMTGELTIQLQEGTKNSITIE